MVATRKIYHQKCSNVRCERGMWNVGCENGLRTQTNETKKKEEKKRKKKQNKELIYLVTESSVCLIAIQNFVYSLS